MSSAAITTGAHAVEEHPRRLRVLDHPPDDCDLDCIDHPANQRLIKSAVERSLELSAKIARGGTSWKTTAEAAH